MSGGPRGGRGGRARLGTVLAVLLGAALLVAVAEIAARRLFPVLEDAEAWVEDGGLLCLRSGLRAWVAGATLSTDAGGRRPGVDPDGGERWRVLIAGGRFTAAVGLEDGESFPARMEALLREQWKRSDAEVVAAAALGPAAAKTRWILQQVEAVDPRVVIAQVEAFDCGRDGTLLAIPGEGRTEGGAPSSMFLDLLGSTGSARAREAEEQACADLVERDGFFARAIEGARSWTLHWTDPGLQGDDAVHQRRIYNAVLSDRYGAARTAELAAVTDAWVELFDQLKRRGIVVILLPMENALLTAAIHRAALELDVPVLGGVPVHFDPELRVAGRPARVCHDITARCLLALLADLHAIDPGSVEPVDRRDLENLRAVTERLVAYEGELQRAARAALPEEVVLQPETLGLFRGLAADGTFLGQGPAELLVKPDLEARHLVLRLELPAAASAPVVRLRPAGREALLLEGAGDTPPAEEGRSVFSFRGERAPLGLLSLLEIFPPADAAPARFLSLTWD